MNIIGTDFKNRDLNFHLNINSIDSKKEYEKIWLVIDDKSENKINYLKSTFYKVENKINDSIVEFKNVKLPISTKNTILFSFVKAPAFFSISDISVKNCTNSIKFKTFGGNSPYKLEIFDNNNNTLFVKDFEDDEINIERLSFGKYYYNISDKNNLLFEDFIDLSKSETFQNLSIPNMQIQSGINERIDLSKSIDVNEISDISWYKDNYLISKELTIDKLVDGNYKLQLKSKNGCENNIDFNVKILPKENWEGIYPNPVKSNEPFFIKLNHFRNNYQTTGYITIIDALGRIIKKAEYNQDSEIISNSLINKGVYTIIIETINQKNTYQLIVK